MYRVNPTDIVKWYRSKDPRSTGYMSDNQVYNLFVERMGNQYEEGELPQNPFPAVAYNPIEALDNASSSKEPYDVDESPGMLERFVTGQLSAAEHFGDEGVLGIAPEYFQKGYNESFAGAAYFLANGRQRFNPEDYSHLDGDIGAGLASMFIGMASPLDIAILWASKGSGQFTKWTTGKTAVPLAGWATKAIKGRTYRRQLAKRLSTKNGTHWPSHMLESAAGGIGNISMYSAFGYASEDAKQQMYEQLQNGKTPEEARENMDYWRLFQAGSKGYQDSMLAGAAAGLTGSAFHLATVNKISKLVGEGRTKTALAAKWGTGTAAIGAEAEAFTQAHWFMHPDQKTADSWWKDRTHNLGMILGFRAMNVPGNFKNAVMNGSKGILNQYEINNARIAMNSQVTDPVTKKKVTLQEYIDKHVSGDQGKSFLDLINKADKNLLDNYNTLHELEILRKSADKFEKEYDKLGLDFDNLLETIGVKRTKVKDILKDKDLDNLSREEIVKLEQEIREKTQLDIEKLASEKLAGDDLKKFMDKASNILSKRDTAWVKQLQNRVLYEKFEMAKLQELIDNPEFRKQAGYKGELEENLLIDHWKNQIEIIRNKHEKFNDLLMPANLAEFKNSLQFKVSQAGDKWLFEVKDKQGRTISREQFESKIEAEAKRDSQRDIQKGNIANEIENWGRQGNPSQDIPIQDVMEKFVKFVEVDGLKPLDALKKAYNEMSLNGETIDAANVPQGEIISKLMDSKRLGHTAYTANEIKTMSIKNVNFAELLSHHNRLNKHQIAMDKILNASDLSPKEINSLKHNQLNSTEKSIVLDKMKPNERRAYEDLEFQKKIARDQITELKDGYNTTELINEVIENNPNANPSSIYDKMTDTQLISEYTLNKDKFTAQERAFYDTQIEKVQELNKAVLESQVADYLKILFKAKKIKGEPTKEQIEEVMNTGSLKGERILNEQDLDKITGYSLNDKSRGPLRRKLKELIEKQQSPDLKNISNKYDSQTGYIEPANWYKEFYRDFQKQKSEILQDKSLSEKNLKTKLRLLLGDKLNADILNGLITGRMSKDIKKILKDKDSLDLMFNRLERQIPEGDHRRFILNESKKMIIANSHKSFQEALDTGTSKGISTIHAQFKALTMLAEIGSKNGRTLLEILPEDINKALGKGANNFAISTFLKNYKYSIPRETANYIPQVSAKKDVVQVKELSIQKEEGARINTIANAIKTGQVGYIMAKAFKKGTVTAQTVTSAYRPISDYLKKKFKTLYESIPKERRDDRDLAFNIKDNSGKDIVLDKEMLKGFLRNVGFGKAITPSTLRKAITQYAAIRFGSQSNEWKAADVIAHSHVELTKVHQAYLKKAQLKGFLSDFKKLSKEMTTDLFELSLEEVKDKYRNKDIKMHESFKQESTKSEVYLYKLKEGLNGIENLFNLSEGKHEFNNMNVTVREVKGSKQVRFGKEHKWYTKETMDAIVSYMIEQGPRVQEVMPSDKSRVEFEIELDKKVIKELAKNLNKKQIFTGEKTKDATILTKFLANVIRENPFLEQYIDVSRENLNYAGKITTEGIKLVYDKATPQTFFHETVHGLEAFIRASRNERLIEMWDRGQKATKKLAQSKDKDNFNGYKERIKNDLLEKLGKGEIKKMPTEKEIAEIAANEYFTDRIADWALNRYSNKGIASRIGQWAKVMVSRIKEFFGVASPQDVQRLLGEKVKNLDFLKTVFTTGNVKDKFQLEGQKISFQNNKDLLRSGERVFDKFVEEFKADKSIYSKSTLIEMIAKAAGISDPSNFRFRLGDLSTEAGKQDFKKFVEFMSEANLNDAKKRGFIQFKDFLDWRVEMQALDNLRIQSNISHSSNSDIIRRFFDTPSGNIKDMSSFARAKYKSFLMNNFDRNMKDNVPHITDIQIESMLGEADGAAFRTIKNIAKNGMPMYAVMDMIGMKDLSNDMFRHVSLETGHHAKTYLHLERKGQEIFDSYGITSYLKPKKYFGKYKWKNVKELFYLLDYDMRLDKIKNGKLTPFEQDFVNRVFINPKGRGYKNAREFKFNESTGKYTDKNGVPIDQITGKYLDFMMEWRKATEYYRNEIDFAVKDRMTTAEFEQWKKESEIKWIEKDFYVPRIMTEKFKESYNPENQQLLGQVHKETEARAHRHLEKKFGEDVVKKMGSKKYDKEMAEAIESLESSVWLDVWNTFEYAGDSYSSRFLKDRRAFLGTEMKGNDGKMVKTYETSFESVFGQYSVGISKYLANLQVFPEYVSLKGLSLSGYKGQFEQLKAKAKPNQRERIEWAEEKLKQQLGIGDRGNRFFSYGAHQLRVASDVLSKFQLGFGGFGGVKNIITGTSQTTGAFGSLYFLGGALKSLNRQTRNEIYKTGATQLGYKNIDMPGDKGIFRSIADFQFNLGGFPATEFFNRTVAPLAGQMFNSRNIRVISNPNISKNSKKYKKAYGDLQKRNRLSDMQMELLEKYGEGTTESFKNLSLQERALVEKQLADINQQIMTASHVFTQGATLDYFMPEAFGKKWMKPLTLYKRMAYAATVNTARNIKLAFDPETKAKKTYLLAQLAGHYMGGAALLGMSNFLLGTAIPHENDSWWDRTTTRLWRGEFGGLFSEFYNPYGLWGVVSNPVTNMFYPVLVDQARLGLVHLYEWGSGERSGWEAAEKHMRTVVVGYSNMMKSIERGSNPLEKGKLKYRQLYRDFIKRTYPSERDSYPVEFNSRGAYYNDIYKTLFTGSKEQFAEVLGTNFQRLAVDFYKHGRDGEGKKFNIEGSKSWNESVREARKQIIEGLYRNNPHYFLNKKTSKGNWRGKGPIQKINGFNKYLTPAQVQELKSLNRDYIVKLRRYLKYYNQKYGKELVNFNSPY